MEFNDFASQVLFGESLGDKLLKPRLLTDDAPGVALEGDVSPGRAPELRLSIEQRGPRAARRQNFPKIDELDCDTQRGRVLHFFANHELLALELMALVLLRFPEAPGPFRRGIVQTMRDEQRHLKLYIDHMESLGVHFGSQPLNGFFWKMLSSTSSPLKFVTAMSMTFEQANLDFAISYRKIFETVGDSAAAEIMDQVLKDEIRHVRHGLEWFRRWKDPKLNDWEAYLAGIAYPITPARARGFEFSREVREQCGFDGAFIDSLETSGASKGRPPNVYFYNPGQEFELGTPGLAYTSSKLIEEIGRDLEFLMAWLCSPGDVLALRSIPDVAFLRHTFPVLKTPPEMVLFDPVARRVKWKAGRRVVGLKPWGVSAQMRRLEAKLIGDSILGTDYEGSYPLDPVVTSLGLASKVHIPQLRHELHLHLASLGFLQGEAKNPANDGFALCCMRCDSLEAILEAVARSSPFCKRFVAIKAPYGSSGHNQLRVGPGQITDHEMSWIKRVLSIYGALIVEPWRDVLAEFSVQASVDGRGQTIIHGVVRNLSSKQGQYLGSAFGRNLWGLPDEVKRELTQRDVFGQLKEAARFVGRRLAGQGYEGPFGIDGYLYRKKNGVIDCCVFGELNLRFTMGRIALELGRSCQTGRSGLLVLVPSDKKSFVDRLLDSAVEASGGSPTKGAAACFAGGFIRLSPSREGAKVIPVLWLGPASQALEVFESLCR